MKKLLILLLSILISFNSYGEWTKLNVDTEGSTHYIDTDTIKKHGGYVYYWKLIDRLKPTNSGTMSDKTYHQGDCGVNRFNFLSYIWYKQPMGLGSGETHNPSDPEWSYPAPNSMGGITLHYACDYVN